MKLHIPVVQEALEFPSYGLLVLLKHRNKMGFQEMLYVVWDIPPFIYYLFLISYSPKKLSLPSVFCHFRTWGSAAAPSLWFS